MESNVNMAITTIRSKIDIPQCELEREEPLDPQQRIQLETKIKVLTMNLDFHVQAAMFKTSM